MDDQITVMLADTVWHDVLRTDPYPGGVGLPGAVRDQLANATLITQELPVPAAMRVVTFTRQQARELEQWLGDATGRPDVSASMGEALHAVRGGIRLAKLPSRSREAL